MSIDVGLVGHAVAAVAFLILFGLLVASGRRGHSGRSGAWLMAACVVTLVWAVGAAAELAVLGDYGPISRVLEVLRGAGWIVFLVTLMPERWEDATGFASRGRGIGVTIAAATAIVAVDLWVSGSFAPRAHAPGLDLGILAHLAIAVAGLLLVENLYRNTLPEHRWNIKYLCFGIGGLFAYDLALYADALLFQRLNPALLDARGFTSPLIVPLITISAARNPDWSLDVFISRRMVFHSATLLGAGIYLLLMAGAGFFVRELGGQFGPVLLAIFVFAAFLVLVIVLFSGRFRARLKVWISKHFFNYRYDYREEWLRLIETMTGLGGGAQLPGRVITAIADIVESPEGALWLRQDRDQFVLAEAWNCSPPGTSFVPHPTFLAYLQDTQWVVNLDDVSDDGAEFEVPEEIARTERAWLVVPLPHHDRLLGCLTLGRPRAQRQLNWEDYDLLKTAARQAASYLAEQQSARALAESRQFDEFNRRFAFVMHDIKNLVSQLSLMLSNAEKHKDNPLFQEDMLQTVRGSVEKMNHMLVRLDRSGREAAAATAIELGSLLERTVDQTVTNGARLTFDCEAEGVAVAAEPDRLASVMAHLIQNALDATDGEGEVQVRLKAGGVEAFIEIEDDGKGMTPEFVRDQLFSPFRSTKGGGYGIGAYESRELVRELGGSLNVSSKPGEGTKVTICLPIIETAADDIERTQAADSQ